MKASLCLTFTIAFIMLILGCNERYHYAIKNKHELIKLSLYQNITNDNDRSIYSLTTYTSDYKLANQFIFQKTEKKGKVFYTIKYDSIQFAVDNIIGVNLNSSQYATSVCDYYVVVSALLKPYEIKSLIGKNSYSSSNPELTMYFEGGGRLKYYPKERFDKEFKEKYLSDHKKMEEDWYLIY